MNTGKGLNDLGDYEGCIYTSGFDFATLRIRIQTASIYIGVWLPVEWKEDTFTSVITDSIQKIVGIPGSTVTMEYTRETSAKVTTGNIIGFIFFALFLIVTFIGILTEYTTLFNKSNAIDNAKIEANKTPLGLVFLSFSFTRNVAKIFWGTPAKEDDYLVIFNGVRVLSLLYVIFGHGYFSVLMSPLTDFEGVNRVLEPWSFYVVIGGLYAVDVFFFLSAFLGAYLMLSKFFRSNWINVPVIYFHRIYRLIFPIGLVICFVLTFYLFFWRWTNMDFRYSRNYWWMSWSVVGDYLIHLKYYSLQ